MPDLLTSVAEMARTFTSMADKFEQWLDGSDLMDGWVLIGTAYVKPIDWEELWLIEPDGAGYAAYRHHINGDQRFLIGRAPTPRAASRLADDAVLKATGVVDHGEPRRTHIRR